MSPPPTVWHGPRAELVARTALAGEWETLAHTAAVVEAIGDQTGSITRDHEIAVAWLHDVLEDSALTREDLADLGFPLDVINAVVLLTRDDQTPGGYSRYVKRLLETKGGAARIARTVKLADARHNLSRCEQAAGVPKWERLADTRYRPLIYALEYLVADEV